MKYYELSIIVKPDVLDEEANQMAEKVLAIIKELGGALLDNRPILKKRMEYPIKKQRGVVLLSFDFTVAKEALDELNKRLLLEERNMRHLLIMRHPSDKPVRIRSFNADKPAEVIEKPKEVNQPEKKVELKEIEERLEEILKDE
ncbi:MAG: 30S ribosomal protein S6 [bacterium]